MRMHWPSIEKKKISVYYHLARVLLACDPRTNTLIANRYKKYNDFMKRARKYSFIWQATKNKLFLVGHTCVW